MSEYGSIIWVEKKVNCEGFFFFNNFLDLESRISVFHFACVYLYDKDFILIGSVSVWVEIYWLSISEDLD